MTKREIAVIKLAIKALEVKPNYVVKPRVTSAIVIGKLKEIVRNNEISVIFCKTTEEKDRAKIIKLLQKSKGIITAMDLGVKVLRPLKKELYEDK